MSVESLKKSTGLTVPAPNGQTKALTFPEMLESFKVQIAAALPRHLNADRMVRIAMTEFRKNPDLARCDPKSVFASIIIAAQLGLEPGVMGQAYLIPYNKVCTLVPGWQGYVDLVARAGRASVWTDAVRAGDTFRYSKGTSPSIIHEPGDGDDDSPFAYVYAVGRIKNAEWPVIEVWSRAKVQKHLKQYNKVGTRHYALQSERNLEMYGRKACLMQVIKYLPKSVELQAAAELDYSANAGAQNISVNEAIAGTFQPSGYPEDSPAEEAPAKKPPARVEPTRQDEIFDLLMWNEETRKKWLTANANLSDGEQISKLEAELDK